MNPVGDNVNIYDSLFITSYLSGCQCGHQSFLQLHQFQMNSWNWFGGWLAGVIMSKLNWHGQPYYPV